MIKYYKIFRNLFFCYVESNNFPTNYGYKTKYNNIKIWIFSRCQAETSQHYQLVHYTEWHFQSKLIKYLPFVSNWILFAEFRINMFSCRIYRYSGKPYPYSYNICVCIRFKCVYFNVDNGRSFFFVKTKLKWMRKHTEIL